MNQITPATPGEVPKTSRNMPTKPPLYSVALMRAALIDARGLKSRAAVILGCNRRTVNEYISRAAGHAAPLWLKDRALDKWYELWGGLLDRNHLDPRIHGDLVALYCESYGNFREAVEKLASMGALVKDKNDRVVPNPYVDIRDTAMRQMTDIGERLGLTPSASVRWQDYAPKAQEQSHEPSTATPGTEPVITPHNPPKIPPMKKPFFSVALVRAAPLEPCGLKSRAATILGCNRCTTTEYIKRHKELQDVLVDIEMAEAVVDRHLEASCCCCSYCLSRALGRTMSTRYRSACRSSWSIEPVFPNFPNLP